MKETPSKQPVTIWRRLIARPAIWLVTRRLEQARLAAAITSIRSGRALSMGHSLIAGQLHVVCEYHRERVKELENDQRYWLGQMKETKGD